MAYVQKLVTEDSYDATNTLVRSGHVGTFDTERLNGDEKHLKPVGNFQEAFVEMSAISPTGPNPTIPQQIAPDVRQGPGGNYQSPGKTIIGERTVNADQRLAGLGLDDDQAEAKVTKALQKVGVLTEGGAPQSGAATAEPSKAAIAVDAKADAKADAKK